MAFLGVSGRHKAKNASAGKKRLQYVTLALVV